MPQTGLKLQRNAGAKLIINAAIQNANLPPLRRIMRFTAMRVAPLLVEKLVEYIFSPYANCTTAEGIRKVPTAGATGSTILIALYLIAPIKKSIS